MKKLLLCTFLMSLWTIGSVMPKIMKPEENPKYKELSKQMDAQNTVINSLRIKLAQAELDGSANPPTVRKEIKAALNKYIDLARERGKLYLKLKKEYDKLVKSGEKD